jgi:hypothetical protein
MNQSQMTCGGPGGQTSDDPSKPTLYSDNISVQNI